MRSWFIGVFMAVMLLATSVMAVTTAADVKSFTLENGMKVMVLEDHSIPNANMYLFWKVGSRNEVPGITGLSHFFEHMNFNGAKKYGPKMFDRTMEGAGGANNAYTSENITAYTDWFPADAMEVIFDLEADRIADLAIDPQMVESERGVVISERTTGLENSNFRTVHQEVKATAFQAHPYRWSVIGHLSDILNWTQEDLELYHKTYYAPNNAVVVISGDVYLDEVKRLATQYFGPIPAQDPPRKVVTVEPEQKGERRVFVKKESVSTPNIMMAYHVPNTRHADWRALELLSDILSSGKSSRLYNSLVNEQQLCNSVFSWVPDSFDPTLFSFFAVAAADVTADTLEKAMISEINRVAKEGVTENELEKVKNRRLVDFYRNMSTINGKADAIGNYELFYGDYSVLFNAPELYKQVTVDDVKRVAGTYLKKSNRTIGVVAAQEEGE